MARQQLLLLSAIMSMVLFAVVTIPADVRPALNSHQPLSWLVSVVVYAALVAHRRFPLATVAVATIGSVVLMIDGMAYPLTLPAVFCALYWVALDATQRLRIARELHDAVGQHVALINVQAGALACLLDDEDRSQARESVTHIQRASEEALEELRLTVGLLREPGAAEPPSPAEPVPGLDRLEELICSFAGAGLQVTREVTGQVRPLPEAVELTWPESGC